MLRTRQVVSPSSRSPSGRGDGPLPSREGGDGGGETDDGLAGGTPSPVSENREAIMTEVWSNDNEEDGRGSMNSARRTTEGVGKTAPIGVSSSILHRRVQLMGITYAFLGLVVGAMVGFAAFVGSGVVFVGNVAETASVPGELSYPRAQHRQRPRVAWLMSFPNSGTSYTIGLVRAASLRYTATNYGWHNVDPEVGGGSLPVYQEESPTEGPFWSDPGEPAKPYNKTLSYPTDGYVLTKTHCGMRCMVCDPSDYIEHDSRLDFLSACLKGDSQGSDERGRPTGMRDKTRYAPNLVHKAIHLVRNPFNNVVARFHLHMKVHPEKRTAYPNDRDGFRKFCMEENARRRRMEENSPWRFLLSRMGNIPCRADFVRYVRWHNRAFETTDFLQIPTMVVHFEDYGDKFEETLRELLAFLESDFVGDPLDFIAGKDYLNYYTEDELLHVGSALKDLASKETWVRIQRYFVDKGEPTSLFPTTLNSTR